VSFLRSGGSRLQEGVAALTGMPRATLALAALARAGVGHVAVIDHPTTGGVWVTIASQADLRVALAGATVGFAGPRVLAAVTGMPPPPDSHTAAAAHSAGLVDAALDPGGIREWLGAALASMAMAANGGGHAAPAGRAAAALASTPGRSAPGRSAPGGSAPGGSAPERGGWAQVLAAREGSRPDAGDVLAALLPVGVDFVGRDRTVGARLGLLAGGGSAVGVALAARRSGTPGADGYRLLTRAARLAGRLGLPLVTLVDTPGADPSPAAEADGVAAAIGEAMAAVLECPSPTVSLIVGEGGSGGALAAACTDKVMITTDGYFTVLAPEGSAVTLHITPDKAADIGGLRPADLVRLGIIDGGVAPGGVGAAGAESLAKTLTASVRVLTARDPASRMSNRHRKWSTGIGGGI
jgi:acetyl-CoA carboxylase carboxyl transferase subunit beta